MAAGKTPESKRWILGIFPRQRPKEEWEHVYVTRNGGRYVDVEELFARKSVQKDLAKMKKLGEEERRRNSARTALMAGACHENSAAAAEISRLA